MEKVTKSALCAMKAGDIKTFYVPDDEAVNAARVTIYRASNSRMKGAGVSKYEGKKDGDIMVVRAIGCE